MLDRTTPPAVHLIGDLQLPRAYTSLLDNGAMLYTYAAPCSGLCQLTVTMRGGIREAANPAIASIFSSTVTEGAGGKGADAISAVFDFYGARVRAIASSHHTSLTMQVLASKLPDVLPTFCDIMLHPDFDETVIDNFKQREAKVLLQSQAQVGYMSHWALNPLIMGPRNPNAYPQTIEQTMAVSRDSLFEFHRKHYVAQNATAFFFGEYDNNHLELVRQALNRLTATHTTSMPCIVPFEPMPPQRILAEKADALQNAIRIGIPTIPRTDPDYLPLRFTVMALGGYFGSRLSQNIREDKGYTYGIQSVLAGTVEGSLVSISAQCDPSYTDCVIEETANEMRRLADEPMSEAELNRVKQTISSSLIESTDSPFALCEYYKTMTISPLPEGYFADQVRTIHTMTPEAVQAIAARYLNPGEMRIAVAGRQ